ncbi:hypothetical protein LWC35_21090 [Pseudonocardia kujensis]|uniref:HEPN domain-containing protein n=1 Tax=Pseudonocardia kujensis TaxID=1128675 RepID=UPI001E58A663|nr:HEPN domain-containing protein [Pseudonocardia kujensis]MCE0765378.1 hypothetical protein [Pseudonocardia kujensis]
MNYDGDIILEYDYPFRVKRSKKSMNDPDSSFQWPNEVAPDEEMERLIRRLRIALMLTVERPERAQLVPTWRHLADPLAHTPSASSWNDPRGNSSFMPMHLSESEVERWGNWYQKLDTPAAHRLDLAFGRILRAVAERREVSDLLVDSVIALENIFGTSEGEPTFRISMSLAVLLESDENRREEMRSLVSRIYGLRSRVVHGSGVIKSSENQLCWDALDIAIRAVKCLVGQRTEILELADGSMRSAAVLLKSS